MTEIQLPIGLGINHFFVPQNSKYCPPMRTHGNHEQKTVHAWIDSNADGKLTEVVGMNLMTEPFIATSEIVLTYAPFVSRTRRLRHRLANLSPILPLHFPITHHQ
jgi:hypothetical protein